MAQMRCEQEHDRNQVYRIHVNAFERNDEADLVENLRRNKQFDPKLSFVAFNDKEIIGHILFTPIEIVGKSISSLALAPVSIRKDYQNQGFGSQLIRYALNEIKAKGFQSVVVLGHEYFYPKFGFVPANNFRIRPPFNLENENCFMVLELVPGAIPKDNREGIVQYLPEFGL